MDEAQKKGLAWSNKSGEYNKMGFLLVVTKSAKPNDNDEHPRTKG
jgi:hypothetical protein